MTEQAITKAGHSARRVKRPAMPPFMSSAVAPIAFFLVFVAAWEVLPEYFDVPDYILPKFSGVISVFANPSVYDLYLYHSYVTLTEAALGLLIGGVAGLVVAFVLTESRVLMNTFYPYIIGLQCMPKVALAPLLVIWFGFGLTSKVVVAALLCFFPVLVNTILGIRSVKEEHAELFYAIRAPRWQKLVHLVIPSALPHIITGFELALVVSLLGALVGEFVGAQAGLGVLLLQAQFQMDIPSVFATLGILALMGVLLNLLVRSIRRRALYWIPAEGGKPAAR